MEFILECDESVLNMIEHKYKPQWDLAKSFGKDVETLKSSFVACENIKCHSYLENQFENSSKCLW